MTKQRKKNFDRHRRNTSTFIPLQEAVVYIGIGHDLLVFRLPRVKFTMVFESTPKLDLA